MTFNVNPDHGIAIDMQKIACYLRIPDRPDETEIVLVSGNKFILKKPFSEVVSNTADAERARMAEKIIEFLKQYDPAEFGDEEANGGETYARGIAVALAEHLITK